MLPVKLVHAGERTRVSISLDDALRGWHEYYAVLATAASTIMAAMFVVASIASGFLKPERASETRFFLTPTVIHLAAVLFASALVLVPSLDGRTLGVLAGLVGLAGLVYSCAIGWNVSRRGPGLELIDRLWYGLLPVAGYIAMLAAALMAFRHGAYCLETFAAALAFLLLAGIRNAWDLLLFFVIQSKGPAKGPD
jgi:hypothetical protein